MITAAVWVRSSYFHTFCSYDISKYMNTGTILRTNSCVMRVLTCVFVVYDLHVCGLRLEGKFSPCNRNSFCLASGGERVYCGALATPNLKGGQCGAVRYADSSAGRGFLAYRCCCPIRILYKYASLDQTYQSALTDRSSAVRLWCTI